MQSKPRLLANLLVKLARMNPYRCMGAMGGGLTPLTEPLPGCIPPPRRVGNPLGIRSGRLLLLPQGAPFGGEYTRERASQG